MRLKITLLAIVWSLALAGCSAAASPSLSEALTPVATASPSAGASAVSPFATTAPADVAPSGATTVAMSSFMFAPSAITVTAGRIAFFLQNVGVGDDPIALQRHNIVIGVDQDHALVKSGEVPAGKAVVFTVEGLAPGTYAIWCSVKGHSFNGMVGTLTVLP